MVPSLQSNGGTSMRGNKADTAAQWTSAEHAEGHCFPLRSQDSSLTM